MHYDVIIIGSGPAGAAAAAYLAKKRCSVLILEKAKHPRHKSCGGGLSASLLPYLERDVKEIIEQEVFKVSFVLDRKQVTFSSPSPIAYLVTRPRFDAYLTDKARAAGAEVREEAPMLAWRETPDGVEVQSLSRKDTAFYLIGADGAASRVARQIHPLWKKRLAFSMEANTPICTEEGTVQIDLSVSKGYGWVFPKGSESAIGIAGFKGKEKRPHLLYSDFLKRHDLLSEKRSTPPLGCVIPLYRRSSFPLVQGRVLLVGDAGALVDPLFGEGIYYAVRSGQMAASAVSAALSKGGSIQLYDRKIRTTFYPEFEVAAKMARWIYTFPGLFLEANRRHPKAMQLYFGVLRGERSYCEFWKAVRKEFLLKWNPFRRLFATSSRP